MLISFSFFVLLQFQVVFFFLQMIVLVSLCCYKGYHVFPAIFANVLVSLCCYNYAVTYQQFLHIRFSFFVLLHFFSQLLIPPFFVLVSLCCYWIPKNRDGRTKWVLVSLCCYNSGVSQKGKSKSVLVSLCCYKVGSTTYYIQDEVLVSLCCYIDKFLISELLFAMF